MSRNASGTYSLPAGNPVVTGTTITTTWANTTLSDLATEMTDSLSRSGNGGMLDALKMVDGSAAAPALTFTSEIDLGLYRKAAGTIAFADASADLMELSATALSISNAQPRIRLYDTATTDENIQMKVLSGKFFLEELDDTGNEGIDIITYDHSIGQLNLNGVGNAGTGTLNIASGTGGISINSGATNTTFLSNTSFTGTATYSNYAYWDRADVRLYLRESDTTNENVGIVLNDGNFSIQHLDNNNLFVKSFVFYDISTNTMTLDADVTISGNPTINSLTTEVGGTAVTANEGGQINFTKAPNSTQTLNPFLDSYIDAFRMGLWDNSSNLTIWQFDNVVGGATRIPIHDGGGQSINTSLAIGSISINTESISTSSNIFISTSLDQVFSRAAAEKLRVDSGGITVTGRVASGDLELTGYIDGYGGTPTDGQVMTYVGANSRFEATDASGFIINKAGGVWHGRVDSAGTTVNGNSGFTVSWSGTFNKYTVTHNLATLGYTVLVTQETTELTGVPQGIPLPMHYIPFNNAFTLQFEGGVQKAFSFTIIED